MTEPLVVDSARLKTAGAKLGELVLPSPPAPLAVTGSDPVSAAIKETLPVIETPVVDALPAVSAANARTGSSITIAAGIYADTDRRLAEHVSSVQVESVSEKRAGPRLGATANSGSSLGAKDDLADEKKTDGKTTDGKTTDGPTPTPQPTPPPAPQPAFDYNQISKQLGQAAAASKAMGPLMQNVQSVMSSVQGSMGGMGGAGGGGAPAELASATSAADHADQARLVDDTKPDDTKPDDERDEPDEAGDPAEGAAAGEQSSPGVPLPTTAGRPPVTPSGIEL